MPNIDRLEVSFQKRNTKGLDAYEHEQASVTAVLALDDGEDPNSALSQTSTAVRGQVHALLGLSCVGENEVMPAGAKTSVNEAPPEKTPTDVAREQPASPHPAEQGPNERIQQAHAAAENKATGHPSLPTGTKSVRGQNAVELAYQLQECVEAGIEVPEAQLARLPKGWRQQVEHKILQSAGQEPAGSHDDPPVEGPGDPEEGDWHEGPGDPLEGTEAADNGDDIMSQLEQEMGGEPQEEITDKYLQERLRDAASRAGSPQVIMPAVQTYTTDGKHLSTIPQDQRQSFLNRVEQLVKQAQEAQ